MPPRRFGVGRCPPPTAPRAKPGRATDGERFEPASPREGDRLTVVVQPRSSRNEVAVRGDEIRVRVTAPPAEGAANEAVRDLLARTLGCPRSAVEIVRGLSARTKRVRISGLSADAARARLGKSAGEDGWASPR